MKIGKFSYFYKSFFLDLFSDTLDCSAISCLCIFHYIFLAKPEFVTTTLT